MRTLLIASTHAQTPQPRTLNPLTPNLETRNPKPEIVNEQIASQADVAGAKLLSSSPSSSSSSLADRVASRRGRRARVARARQQDH